MALSTSAEAAAYTFVELARRYRIVGAEHAWRVLMAPRRSAS
jgi:hypothetical protein